MEQELRHHGIIGQKWGDRNGPPYPLTPDNYNYAERKAKFRSKETSRINKREARDASRDSRMWNRRKNRRDKEGDQLLSDSTGSVIKGGTAVDDVLGFNRNAARSKKIVQSYIGSRAPSKEEARGIARLEAASRTNAFMTQKGKWALNRDYISKLEPREQTAILTEISNFASAREAHRVVSCYRRIDRSAKAMTPAERDHYFDIIKKQLNSD